ncbi:hypothetical protein [Halovivax limisalsi]|uniref:hypothetical protein n=1 Tax=Halovivax limisalsi TaxID=1453760 RepID=UPI001FFC59FA|nr:hypothetical protein [Halovivax limisalsi]
MGFSDWKWVGQSEHFHQSETRAFEGDRSLFVDGQRNHSAKNMAILKQSIDDSPAEAQLETHAYCGNYGSFGMAFRWQDEHNFYAVDSMRFLDNSTADRIGLYKETNGDGTTVKKIQMRNTPNQNGEWFQFRCTVFESEGDVHVRPEFRESMEHEWTRYNENEDLIDSNPGLADGGGVGMVFYNPSSVDGHSRNHWFDRTRIYYDK